jgi:hypothetical protein
MKLDTVIVRGVGGAIAAAALLPPAAAQVTPSGEPFFDNAKAGAQPMRTPYSFGPFYISQRIKTFNRAGEDAVLLGSTFSLAPLGFVGFSIDVNVSDGRHAIDANSGAALPKWREFDTDFVYRFAEGSAVPGMRLRLRWATVREDFGSRVDRTDDFRLDLNGSVAFN